MPVRKKRRKADLKREKRRALRLAERVCRFLQRKRSWKISYIKLSGRKSSICQVLEEDNDLDGWIRYGWQVIAVDYRSSVIVTIVHECLHALHQKKPEKEILRLEKLVVRHMTADHATRIHRLMTKRLK